MNKDLICKFAAYNTWINSKIFNLSLELSDSIRKEDLNAFFKSIHGTLNHILLADRRWMRRLTNKFERYSSYDSMGELIPETSLDQELYSNFNQLFQERTKTDRDIENWATCLEQIDIDKELSYVNTLGKQTEPKWWAIAQLFNHQTHHRGQVTTLLSQMGIDPGIQTS